MYIPQYLLPSASVVIFAVAIILFSMTERRTHYRRVVMACLALVLVPLTFILNEYLAYALQALVLLAIANLSRQYYKAGFFRRKKELMELFRHDHPEHREARALLYHPLQDIDSRERALERKIAEIDKVEKKLQEQEQQLIEEKMKLKETKAAVKGMHREAME